MIVVDRGPWYDWALDDLDLCESRRETWGERSLVEAWFGLFKYRTRLFYSRSPHYSSWKSVERWTKAFAAIHNAITQPGHPFLEYKTFGNRAITLPRPAL